jgi:hypothetical protein
MTRDERIEISTRELEKLPADELEVIVRHFQTEDRAELARQLADEAEEMWSGDHEAPVPEEDWPSAHLQMILGMHRDEKREALLAEQRRNASAAWRKCGAFSLKRQGACPCRSSGRVWPCSG